MRTAGPTCPEAVVVEGEGAGTPSGSARLEAVAILQVVYRSLDELPGARGNGQGESAVQRKRKRHLIREARHPLPPRGGAPGPCELAGPGHAPRTPADRRSRVNRSTLA